MKRFLLFPPGSSIIRLVISIAVLATVLAIPQTAFAASNTPNPAAEEYLLAELRATGYVDFRGKFSDAESIVGAEVLFEALNDPEVQSKPTISVLGVTVVGDVVGSNLILPANLLFTEVHFTDNVWFNNADLRMLEMYDSVIDGNLELIDCSISRGIYLWGDTFNQSINLTGFVLSGNAIIIENPIAGNLLMMRANLGGNVDMRWNTIQGNLNLYGTSITGELLLDDTQILAPEAIEGTSYPLELWTTNVGGLLSMLNTQVVGPASFEKGHFGRIEVWGAAFQSEVNSREAIVDNSAQFNSTDFAGPVDFSQTSFGRAEFQESTFHADVTFFNATIGSDMDFTDAVFESKDLVVLSDVQVGDSLLLENVTANSGFDLSHGVFANLKITAKDSGKINVLDISYARASGRLEMRTAKITKLYGTGLASDGSATLDNLAITQTLDLRNARLNLLVITDLTWPASPESFNLRGMTFTDIDLGNKGLTEETWQGLLYLVDQSAFSPQSYTALMTFLTDKGHPTWAAEVDLHMKRRERDEVLEPFSTAWFWSWFLELFTGYGQRPLLALLWSLVVVTIGTFVYRKKDGMVLLGYAESTPPYNPVIYSLSLFLPYIDLEIAGKWDPKPDRSLAWAYKHVHKLLGWILMPIALLAFSGIIK